MCDQTGPFGVGALVCTLPGGHVNGHRYESAWAADGHDATEARDE